ncbi:ABC transporter ATP-binding protein [Patescibacteria group bacterium]|nr:MAG: ABC transporter ATP-binding protein [Patescibacteria group bacterium]
MSETILRADNIHKAYEGTEVLHGASIDIARGALTLITGPSGSGKTTLLNIMSGIERPDSGRVESGQTEVTALDDEALAKWRGENLGFVFQESRLLSNLTVAENIVGPMLLRGGQLTDGDARWAMGVSEMLGITPLLNRSAEGLSGGQRQRIAIARGLAHRPELLVADEPTASVDGKAKTEIHSLMRSLVEEVGVTIVMVSHDELSREYADTIVEVHDGVVQG